MRTESEKYFQLLLHILRDGVRTTRTDRILASDWDHVIRLAIGYDIAPLLFPRVKRGDGIPDVPATIIQRLQRLYFYNAAKNMHLYNDFSHVCGALASEGIEVVALKGVHLAEAVYKDIALRQMGDIDILVRKEDLSKAQETLLKMGYGPADRPAVEKQCVRSQHLVRFIKEGRAPIEVHWTLARPHSPFKGDIKDFWERAKKTTLAGAPVFVLSPEDLLLHLCLHVSLNHAFTHCAIKNICDIAETMNHYRKEIGCERIVSTAHSYNISEYIFSTLSLTRALLGTEIPSAIGNLLTREDADTQLLATFKKHILFKTASDDFVRRSFERPVAFHKLREAESLRGKIVVLLRSLVPSVEHLTRKYSLLAYSKVVYLYYLVHLVEILIRGCILLVVPKRLRAQRAWFLGKEGKRTVVIEKWAESRFFPRRKSIASFLLRASEK